VEVMGRYSNHADEGERLRRLLQTVPEGAETPTPRTIKRVLRRLTHPETEQLLAAYTADASQRQLARDFKIHSQTVAAVLDRGGVGRRDGGLHGDRLDLAIRLYRSGESLRAVGDRLNVNAETVRRYLNEAGEPLRQRPGCKTSTSENERGRPLATGSI
jgi:hypothetical protein